MVRARKRFGQHFLHDPAVIVRLIACIDPRPAQNIVEIGPGRGAMTRPLLEAAGRLTVVEIDRDLPEVLARHCAGAGNLEIINADALRFDFAALASDRNLRVAGNLPYNISSPLLFHLLGQSRVIQDMHFMLQQEVVDRLAAVPGTSDYGRLTVSVAVRAGVEKLFTIGPGAFQPPPAVWSAVVRITPFSEQPGEGVLRKLDQLLIQAFSRRRKTLRNALQGLADVVDLEACDINPTLRPEALAPDRYLALAESLLDR